MDNENTYKVLLRPVGHSEIRLEVAASGLAEAIKKAIDVARQQSGEHLIIPYAEVDQIS